MPSWACRCWSKTAKPTSLMYQMIPKVSILGRLHSEIGEYIRFESKKPAGGAGYARRPDILTFLRSLAS